MDLDLNMHGANPYRKKDSDMNHVLSCTSLQTCHKSRSKHTGHCSKHMIHESRCKQI